MSHPPRRSGVKVKPLPVELDGLACERDERELFASLSLRLEPGEVLQVAGPNGSGKTSLLRIMAGLRSEERRVGKECRTRRSPYDHKTVKSQMTVFRR